MQITINGSAYNFNESLSVAALMQELQLDARKVAIEKNLAIIPANEYADNFLQEGDILEVVQFIGGG